jgi:hypothetical protein
MSTNNWFAQVGPKRIGPLAFGELQRLASTGELSTSSFVSADGVTWQEAGRLPELKFAPPLPAFTSAPIAPSSPADWHLQSRDGKRFGPVTKAELESWVAGGSVTSACLVWQEGWPGWKVANEVFPQFAIQKPAPVVPAASPPACPAFVPSSPDKPVDGAENVLMGIGLVAIIGVVLVGGVFLVTVGIPAVHAAIGSGGIFVIFMIGRAIVIAMSQSGKGRHQ